MSCAPTGPSPVPSAPPQTLPLLWSAPIGTASKFDVPTASNGIVYVGSRKGELFAFGSKANAPPDLPADFGPSRWARARPKTSS